MTRIEENKRMIEELIKKSKELPKGTYEEIMGFNIAVISSTLTDISKSLAIIVHNMESGGINNECE